MLCLATKWCQEHKVIINYKDEQVTFVYKDRSEVRQFHDYCAQMCVAHFSLYLILQAARFV